MSVRLSIARFNEAAPKRGRKVERAVGSLCPANGCFNEAAPKRGRKGPDCPVRGERQVFASMRPPPNGGGRDRRGVEVLEDLNSLQ